mmetsp:Transcript_42426/g.103973  ORF Transcript_42426/g.103973 Transcript_42426/m.103973 type:complete len:295 (+) Transcript_42426:253-1137(+)
MGQVQGKERLPIGAFRVKKKELLGEGRFGDVWVVKDKETKRRMALKVMAVPDEERLQMAENELAMLRAVSPHPHIVELHGSGIFYGPSGKDFYLLTELCSGGQLSSMLAARTSALPEKEALQIFLQVCLGVEKLHTLKPNPIVHRDIKAENIVLDSGGKYKLCDFGSATHASSRGYETKKEKANIEDEISRLTTLQYRAPEMIDLYSGKDPLGLPTDVWALGCLLFYLSYNRHAFPNGGLAKIVSAAHDMPAEEECTLSPDLRQLIVSILKADPDERPDTTEVIVRARKMGKGR